MNNLQQKPMKLSEGKRTAEAFVDQIRGQCHRIEIVGSIRRGKAEVRDVDLVAIPKNPRTFLAGIQADQRGEKIIRLTFQGAKIDLYLATENNYQVLRLIRTGSAAHNVKLAMIARKKGWQMTFDRGLITPEGTVTSEREVLEKVFGRYIKPEERE
jgi:DNA polymerase/3'-5' exonuclease PolX